MSVSVFDSILEIRERGGREKYMGFLRIWEGKFF